MLQSLSPHVKDVATMGTYVWANVNAVAGYLGMHPIPPISLRCCVHRFPAPAPFRVLLLLGLLGVAPKRRLVLTSSCSNVAPKLCDC
jgi:hypothetical protein